MTKTPAEKVTQDTPLVSIAEAQMIAPLSKRTYGRLCERGTIKAVKVGRRWLISRESLMALLEPAL